MQKQRLNKLVSALGTALMASIIIYCGCTENVPRTHSLSKTDSNQALSGLDPAGFLTNHISSEPAVKNISQWENPYGQGLLVETDHYEIYTTLLEPVMLRRVPAFMESAHRAYQKIVNRQVTSPTKMKIYIFAQRKQWELFSETFTGSMWPLYQKIQKGAYYLNGSCVTYNIGMTRTFSALAHEGWHQFSSRHFSYRLPSWLDEGLAMHFETFEKKMGFYEFVPEKNLPRLGGLKLAIRNNSLVTMHSLIGMNPGDVVTGSQEQAVNGYYSQAYALVRFLREYNYGVYREDFDRMLFGGLEGTWPVTNEAANILSDRNIPMSAYWNREFSPKLFEYYFSNDYNYIQKQYMGFCMKLASQVRISKQTTPDS